jgi:hypothetical protein
MTHAFIGLMVLYRVTEEEALATNKRREDARQNIEKMREERPGFQAHVGNLVSEGERVPMIITQVWPNEFGPDRHGVNGQAFLDGNDSLWVTSVEEGDLPGQWEPITDG